MIKAVVLDIGGVVLSYVPGSDVDGRWEARLGLAAGSIHERVWSLPSQKAAEVGAISIEEFWAEAAEALGLDAATASAFYEDCWANNYFDDRVATWMRGLRPRYRVATLSNSWSDGRRQCVERIGLDALVDLMVFSAEVGVAKPDERIYRHTLDALGVEPSETLFVDDRLENVEAASALGIHALRSTDPERLLAEAPAILERLG